MENTSIISFLNQTNTVQISLSKEWQTVGDYCIKATYGTGNTERCIGFHLTNNLLIPFKNQTITFLVDTNSDVSNVFQLRLFKESESSSGWELAGSVTLSEGEQTASITTTIPEDILKIWLRIDTLIFNEYSIFTDNWRCLCK